MKRQGVYWLCPSISQDLEEKSQWLSELDYEVTFFSEFEELFKELQSKRVPILVLSDDFGEEAVGDAMEQLASMPDIQGARLILSLSKPSKDICFKAACNGFRDILPTYLEHHEWLDRFQFSTSGHHDPDSDKMEERSINELEIKLGIPGRIAWFSNDSLWLESKLRPEIGENIELDGAFSEDLSGNKLPVQVKSQEQTNLVYRFSEAAICNWQHLSSISDEKLAETMELLKTVDQGEKQKVFIAMQSPALRMAIMKYLDLEKYDIYSALQKKSLVNEPKYFTPSLIFIEYRLCEGEAMSRFQDMVAHIPEHSTVVLVGAKPEDLASFKNFALGRRVEALFQLPKNLPDLIRNNYLKKPVEAGPKKFHVPRRHPYSYAEIPLQGKIIQVDGDFLKIKIPSTLANYGLLRLYLGDDCQAFAKVISVSSEDESDKTFICRINFMSQEHKHQVISIIQNN